MRILGPLLVIVLELAATAASAQPPAQLGEVQIRGRGDQVMVLVPCMSCRWQSWEPLMARNADRWRMYAVTLPGFGGSAVPALEMNGDSAVWHDHAVAAVVALFERENLRDVVLVGHSFGATIALQVAARVPARVKALVNVDGGITSSRTWFRPTAEERVEAARALTLANEAKYADAEAWRVFNAAMGVPPDRQVLYHGMFMATPRAVVFQYWRENLLRDLNPILQSLTVPVLDLKALRAADPDPEAGRARHLELLREAGAPASLKTTFLYNTGHFVHEQRPALLEDVLTRFLDGRHVTEIRPEPPRAALPARFGHVERMGTGPVSMILMPCLGCDWRAFDEFMARNAARYRMYAVTWPGMGTTPLPRTTGAAATPLLDNVVAALDRLIREEKLERPILVGHSAAGPVAIKFASEHPDLLGGVITVDATIQNDTTLGYTRARRDDWADAEMARVLRRHDDDAAWLKLNTAGPGLTRSAARSQMYQEMWRTPPRAHVLQYWREWLRLDAGALLPGIKVPTLALFAIKATDGQGPQTRATIREQFRRNRASSAIAVEFVEPATHSIWETRPEAFDAAVAAFVSSVQRRGEKQPNR